MSGVARRGSSARRRLLHEAGKTTSGRYGIWGGLTPKQRARMDPSAGRSLITCPECGPEPKRTSTPGSLPATAGGGAADRARPLPGGDRPPSRVTVNQVVPTARRSGRAPKPSPEISMTKLASALPDGHGPTPSVAPSSRSHTASIVVVIGIVGTKAVTTDYEKGSKEPTVGVRKIEAVTITDDLPMVQKLLIRATDKREGKTVLPIEVEDDLADAFKIRPRTSTPISPPPGNRTRTRSRPSPTRLTGPCGTRSPRPRTSCVSTRTDHAGRARRVLELAARRLEENDKRLPATTTATSSTPRPGRSWTRRS